MNAYLLELHGLAFSCQGPWPKDQVFEPQVLLQNLLAQNSANSMGVNNQSQIASKIF